MAIVLRILSVVELCLCLLLALSGHRSEGRCPNHTLNLVAFVPCYDDTSLEWSESQCDVFVYSAAQLAADHINRDPSILSNVTVDIRPLYGHEVRLVSRARPLEKQGSGQTRIAVCFSKGLAPESLKVVFRLHPKLFVDTAKKFCESVRSS